MDRLDLELLVALDNAGSVGGAAAVLHTAQPALSRRLARVERELGGRLFDRGRHGAVPTPAGRVAVERARVALDAIVATEQAGSRALAGETGRLVVGAAPTLGAELLPEALARHRRDHPEVGFELVVSGDNPGLRRRLLDGELDVAVTILPDELEPGLRVATSAPQPIVVALPSDHPLAARSRIPRAALADLGIITLVRGEGMRTMLDELFAELDVTPDIRFELSGRELIVPFVAAGLGAAVLPERYGRQRAGSAVTLRPLSPPLARKVGAVVRVDHGSRLVSGFVQTLARSWPEAG
jgi:DNA-binding transcriptional LysR family regulator